MKSDELEVVSQQVEAESQASTEGTRTVLGAALVAVAQFLENPLAHSGAAVGVAERTRSGMKREVNYLELQVEDEGVMVIEVYSK